MKRKDPPTIANDAPCLTKQSKHKCPECGGHGWNGGSIRAAGTSRGEKKKVVQIRCFDANCGNFKPKSRKKQACGREQKEKNKNEMMLQQGNSSSSQMTSHADFISESELLSLQPDFTDVKHVVLVDLDNWLSFFTKIRYCFEV